MQDRQILVTGGAGFIGSNIANTLVEFNEVVVVDDESLGTKDHLDDAVDFHRRSVLEDNLPVEDIDLVIHFAARSSYGLVEQDPPGGFRVNVEGFVNTVDQAVDAGCEQVIYASSSSVYDTHTSPVTVTDPVKANTGYEASKLAREHAAEYLSAHRDITIAGLRLFSVYQGMQRGEKHKGGYANVLAQFAEQLAEGQAPALYGDGSQARDFIHVDDVVAAVEAAATAKLDGIYNVGTGTAASFNEVVERLNRSLGTDIPPTYIEHPMPPSVYVQYTCADSSELREASGWEPRIDLSEGIDRLCQPYLDG